MNEHSPGSPVPKLNVVPLRSAPPDDLIPLRDAAAVADRSVATLRRWIRRRRIRAWKRLGELYVSRAELEGALAWEPHEPGT